MGGVADFQAFSLLAGEQAPQREPMTLELVFSTLERIPTPVKVAVSHTQGFKRTLYFSG